MDINAEMFTGWIPNIGWIPIVELIGALILAIFIFILIKYRHKAFVFGYDSDWHRTLKKVEMCRVVRDKKSGKKQLDFLLSRKRIRDEFRPFSSGFRQVYLLLLDKDGYYHQIGFAEESINDVETVKAIPSNVLGTQINILKQLSIDYQSKTWWDKWGQYVVPVALVVAVIVMWIYGIDKIEAMHNAGQALLQKAIEVHETTMIAK